MLNSFLSHLYIVSVLLPVRLRDFVNKLVLLLANISFCQVPFELLLEVNTNFSSSEELSETFITIINQHIIHDSMIEA